MGDINWVLVPALAILWLALWARDHKPARRSPKQVRADVARRRADRLTQQTLQDTATCKAIAALPTIPNPRKENDR